jgi:hypothetical protein
MIKEGFIDRFKSKDFTLIISIMKKFLFNIFFVTFSITTFSQTQIKLEDAKNHIGDSAIVCGKVYSARFVSDATNEPTFLNLGASYPNQLLTVVIWGDVRKQFIRNPEDIFFQKKYLYNRKDRNVSRKASDRH